MLKIAETELGLAVLNGDPLGLWPGYTAEAAVDSLKRQYRVRFCTYGHAKTGDWFISQGKARVCRECLKERELVKYMQGKAATPVSELKVSLMRGVAETARALEIAKKRKRIRVRNAPKSRRWKLLESYGLTPETYMAMLDAQDHKCKICAVDINDVLQPVMDRTGRIQLSSTKFRACIDHCHATEKLRGILCMGCNRGLGDFCDSPESLRAAAAYLEENRRGE